MSRFNDATADNRISENTSHTSKYRKAGFMSELVVQEFAHPRERKQPTDGDQCACSRPCDRRTPGENRLPSMVRPKIQSGLEASEEFLRIEAVGVFFLELGHHLFVVQYRPSDQVGEYVTNNP